MSTSRAVPSHFQLYRELARVLARHGGRAFLDKTPARDWVADQDDSLPEKLADDLEELGPTFVKLGQLLSTRSDLLSRDYLEALERLQDNVEPLPFEAIRETIVDELGAGPEQLFEWFDMKPLASASLGQVHRARLFSGEEVILKVQRPDVRERVKQELEVLAEVTEALEKHTKTARRYRLTQVVEELTSSLTRELDYQLEARNLERLHGQLEDFPGLIVPRPVPKYSSQRVLTMEYIEGEKLPEPRLRPLLPRECGEELADELFQAYLRQVLLDGTYHADPHPGNVLVTPEGRVALLDLGMVGNMPGTLQVSLARLLMALAEEDGEAAAETALDASGRAEEHNEARFRRQIAELVSLHHQKPVQEMQAGSLIMKITEVAGDNGILVPYELTMLAKTLMNLDEIGRRLAPGFSPTAALRRHTPKILVKRLERDLRPSVVLDQYLEARNFIKDGPRRFNNILRDLENGQFSVRVNAVDERELIVSFQKIANRITIGIVIGALILGASLMLGVETQGPQLFGYPAFAILCFIAAMGGGVWLVWNVLRQDRTSGKELHRPLGDPKQA